MKKKFLLGILIVAILSVLSIGVFSVQANELNAETESTQTEEYIQTEDSTIENTQTDSSNTENTEIEENLKYKETIAQVLEYIIAGIIGLFGTGAVAIGYRNNLIKLINKTSTALTSIKENKETAEEDIKTVQKSALDTLASLKNLKAEIKETSKEGYDDLKKEISALKEIIRLMSSGNKELVMNGSSEKIANIIKNGIGDSNEKNQEIQ